MRISWLAANVHKIMQYLRLFLCQFVHKFCIVDLLERKGVDTRQLAVEQLGNCASTPHTTNFLQAVVSDRGNIVPTFATCPVPHPSLDGKPIPLVRTPGPFSVPTVIGAQAPPYLAPLTSRVLMLIQLIPFTYQPSVSLPYMEHSVLRRTKDTFERIPGSLKNSKQAPCEGSMVQVLVLLSASIQVHPLGSRPPAQTRRGGEVRSARDCIKSINPLYSTSVFTILSGRATRSSR